MHLKERSTPNLGVHLTNDSTALQLKGSWCTTLNSTGNGLSAFWFFDSGVTGDLYKD